MEPAKKGGPKPDLLTFRNVNYAWELIKEPKKEGLDKQEGKPKSSLLKTKDKDSRRESDALGRLTKSGTDC